jgi:hypothetical protein
MKTIKNLTSKALNLGNNRKKDQFVKNELRKFEWTSNKKLEQEQRNGGCRYLRAKYLFFDSVFRFSSKN